MKCPFCEYECNALVLETRKDEQDIYRRRVCANCSKSIITREYTTTEMKLPPTTRVRKKLGRGNVEEGIKADNMDLFRAWR